MTFTLNGSVIDQTGTNTSLAGIEAIAGVTLLSTSNLNIYDLGTVRLNIQGTLTINGTSDAATREMLVIGVGGATQNVDINIADGGTLIVGSLDSQGGVEFNQEQFWPSIYEDAATDFGDGNGNISGDGGTSDAFINIEGGGRIEWYGCINSTGGLRFKGANDGSSTDEAQAVIRGGVLDARRLTERGSGEADQFIYNYSDELDIQPPNGDTVGFTILTMTTTGASEKGLAIIQLGQPIALQGFRPVFSSQALGGSNSAPVGLNYTVSDYTGIVGISGTDNIDLRSASSNATNNSVITFLNTVKGSVLNLATQDPGYDSIVARQTVRGSLVDSVGTARIDAVMATENKNNVITQDAIDGAGDFVLGDILLTEWDDSNPPAPTHNNPSDTDDDLWSFYVYSYLGSDRSRIDVRLRGVGGTDVDFIAPTDAGVTETVRSVADAYTAISDLSRLYDRSKSYKVDNVGDPSLPVPMASAAGNAVDIGALNLIVDGDAGAAYAFATDTITITPNLSAVVTRVGATQAVVEAPEASSIIIAFPGGIQDDDVAYLIVGHAESEDNAFSTPAGWTEVQAEFQSGGTPASIPGVNVYRRVLASDSGNVTVTGSFVSGLVAQMVVYRDVDTTTPEDVTITTATGTTGNPNPPSITPVNGGSMILAIAFGDTEQSATEPGGYSNLLETVTVDGGTEGDRAGGSGSQTFTTTGTTGFVVPAGVTEMEMKVWGAGGGGGGGGTSVAGETGGGGGFAHATLISVTPGETLDVIVGAGGGLGATGGAAEGGGGGGRTRVERQTGSVNLIEAGAGGGGGGGDNSGGAAASGRGGAGGGNTGESGVGSGTSTGGGGGSQVSGGSAGSGNEAGTAGSAGAGGDGGDDDATAGGTANGGAVGGGEGGNISAGFGAGGGGGAGLFGGGGGGSAQATVGSGTGGGGGSSFLTGTTQSNAQGSAATGAGQGDTDYPAGTGDGGTAGATSSNGTAGERGAAVLIWDAGGTSLDGMTLASADFRQIIAGAENPGTFAFSESEEWGALTIAIREDQSGGGSNNLNASAKFSTLNSTGTVTVRDGAGINGLTINSDVVLDDVIDLTGVTINGNLTIGTAGAYLFTGVTVTGDTTNSDAGGNVTINASGGTSVTTSEPGTGNGLVNIVNTVTVSITARDASTSLPILGARVFLEAAAGGPLAIGTGILNALTNASGIVEDAAFNFVSDQPVTGRVRKGSVSPVYKTSPISGTITSNGFATEVFLVGDE